MTVRSTVPPDLQAKLTSLACRIRALRLVRGVSLTLLTLVVLFVGAFALDVWHELSPPGLLIALVTVGAITLVAAARFSIVPLCSRLDAAALAALIEQKYPELGERLLSTVELAEAQGVGHGSPELIALLRRQVVEETRALDVRPSYPARRVRRATIAALVAVAVALIPALAWPRYADFAERFLAAWRNPQPFSVEVESCDGFAARGRPFTISARLVPDRPSRRLPDQCVVLYQEGDQAVRRLPMQPAADQRFTYTISQVQGDFQFQIEAATVVSEVHAVQVIEPVELAASSRVLVTPPAYVNKDVHPPQHISALSDFSALQFSSVRLELHLTRPAATARLHLEVREPKHVLEVPLTWSAHRRAALAELPALDPGSYTLRLTMEAEHAIATVRDLGALRVWADEPPRFVEVPRLLAAAEQAASASLDDILPLRVALEDQVGLDGADLEYRINDGPIQREPILRAEGQRQAAHEFRFHLAGRVKDGDRVQFRLRASDNRVVPRGVLRDVAGRPAPDSDLGPQVIYEPAPQGGKDRWLEISIRRSAAALHEKDLLSQRDDLHKRLEAIKKKLARERTLLQHVRTAVRPHTSVPSEQARELAETRALNREVTKGLQDFADLAERTTPFEALADLARDVAGREMRAADRALAKADDPHTQPEPRDAELGKADDELATAQKRLGGLGEWINRLAQDRLDQLHLERLARREDELAKRAATLADRKDDAAAKAELAKIKADQQRLLEELQRLARKSPMFKEALRARDNPAQPLAQQAGELAQTQRDVAKQIRRPAMDSTAKELTLLAERQQALARKMKQLGEDLQQAKNPLPRLDADPAEQAARALQEGKLPAALERQELALKTLDSLAQRLEGAGSSADPRKTVEQLVKTQAALRKRLEKLAADFATLKAEDAVRTLHQIEREQKGVHDATAKLAVSKDNVAAQKARPLAVEATGRVADLLKRRDALQAFEQMEKAQTALERLRDTLPVRKDPPPAPKSADEKVLREQAAQGQALAKAQQDLRDATLALARKKEPSALSPQESARQHALLEQTRKLAEELQELSRQAGSDKAQHMAREALRAADKAGEAMKQVQSEVQQGHEESARQAAESAAKRLDEARDRAVEAGLRLAMDKQSAAPEMNKLAESLQKGAADAGRSMQHLEKNEPAQASPAMQQAASALQQAATAADQHLKQSRRPLPGGQTPAQSAGPAAMLPPGALPKDLEKLSGRAWGELPGELRTRLLQDMQARYGEDFARIIQGYFESLAEPPRPKK